MHLSMAYMSVTRGSLSRKVGCVASAVTRATSGLHRPPVHLTRCLNRHFKTVTRILKVSAANTDLRAEASKGHHCTLRWPLPIRRQQSW